MLRLACTLIVGAVIVSPAVWAQPPTPVAPPPVPEANITTNADPGGLPGLPPGPRAGAPLGPNAAPPPGAPPLGAPGLPPPSGPGAIPPGAPGALPPDGSGNPPSSDAGDIADPALESAESVAWKPELPAGDVITLKTGKVLRNVQVLKTTLTEIHVQTLLGGGEELPPLVVPRKYVQSIEYDDFDPNAATALAKQQGQHTPGIMSGFAVSRDMGEKLHQKLSPPLNFQDRDLVELLRELSERTGVVIDVSEEVRALPSQNRRWTFQSAEDLTLFLLFQEKLPQKFPDLTVDYQFDRVLVRPKTDGEPANSADAPRPEEVVEARGTGTPID